mgnify:CR=1 FL=1
MLLNETAARVLGARVGSRLRVPEDGFEAEVVGVVRDFHFRPLRDPMTPVVFHMNPQVPLRYLLVKIRPENVPATLAALETTWQQVNPDRPYQYTFLDESLSLQYRAEQRWRHVARLTVRRRRDDQLVNVLEAPTAIH